jgi:hypothetical protein
MPASNQIPWALWGQKATVDLVAVAPGAFQATISQQLTRVDYGRPDTWSFLLGGRILTGPVSAAAAVINLRMQVQGGVGLDRFDSRQILGPASGGGTEGFASFVWSLAAGVVPGTQPANNKFGTRILGPVLDDTVGAGSRQIIDRLPSQAVNVFAEATLGVGNVDVVGQTYKLEVFSFFAPMTHVRPDWYQVDGEPFAGGETGGR